MQVRIVHRVEGDRHWYELKVNGDSVKMPEPGHVAVIEPVTPLAIKIRTERVDAT